MITLTVNRYAFEELDTKAQGVALDQIKDVEYKAFPDYLLSEDMDTKASELLFNSYDGLGSDLKIYYSLSYSQGDGVAFHGEIFASEKPNLTLPANCARVLVTHQGRYFHEYSFAVTLYDLDGEELQGWELVTEELRTICRALTRYGYKWQEDYFSDENLKEIAINAGEIFTATGEISRVSE